MVMNSQRIAGALFLVCATANLSVAQRIEQAKSATAAPVAYVYVGTSKGVLLFDAAPSGALSQVAGSPFQTTGLAIGSNGSTFITLGTNDVHTYPVASGGLIGKQASTIDTQSYAGSNCSDNGTGGGQSGPPATLDHTGKAFYVYFYSEFNEGGSPSGGGCAAIQTYTVQSGGKLSFAGDTLFGDNAGSGLYQFPALLGNNQYAYSSAYFGIGGLPGPLQEYGFKRQSSGVLSTSNFDLTLPKPPAGAAQYLPGIFTGDPTNHVAMTIQAVYVSSGDDFTYGPTQIGSFTADASGNLTTTNTAANMPETQIGGSVLNMSPSGKYLAVGGAGLQIFHFNGASPITDASGVLTGAQIDRIHWDNSNHVYALSFETNQLFVYIVTPSGIIKASGSPYSIMSPDALVVVPQ